MEPNRKKRSPKINTGADRDGFWPQALFARLCLSRRLLLTRACSFRRGHSLLVHLAWVNPIWPEIHAPLNKKFIFFSYSWAADEHCLFSLLPLPSGCEITICLIAGDVRARSQLGWAQIICPAASPRPLLSLPFSNTPALLPLLYPLPSILPPGGGCHSSNGHICEVSPRSDEWLWWANAKWWR